ASLTSVLRPGTCLASRALTRNTVKPRASRSSKIGIQYTLVDSITTVSTPHSLNQFTSRCRSVVKVPKLRTGSGVRSALTAAMCLVAPTSIGAAFGRTPDIVPRPLSVAFFALLANPPVKGEGLDWPVDQFPKRDRRTASPLSRVQQPM